MIKRSSLKFINKLLEENKSWKVLDVGCGYTANKNATTLCDVLDLQNYYPDKEFVKLESKNLPFKDNEFDFVIASHVLEHVKEANFFINELQRIANKGYIIFDDTQYKNSILLNTILSKCKNIFNDFVIENNNTIDIVKVCNGSTISYINKLKYGLCKEDML